MHNAFWYANPYYYSKFVYQDIFIRTVLKKELSDFPIAKVIIKRKLNLVSLVIFSSKVSLSIKDTFFSEVINKLSKLLLSKFGVILSNLNFVEIENSDITAPLIGLLIKQQIEKRIPFRKVLKSALLKVQQGGVKGVKMQIAGRLNGTEIARTEWIREGQVPLQTLKADLDYSFCIARVIFKLISLGCVIIY